MPTPTSVKRTRATSHCGSASSETPSRFPVTPAKLRQVRATHNLARGSKWPSPVPLRWHAGRDDTEHAAATPASASWKVWLPFMQHHQHTCCRHCCHRHRHCHCCHCRHCHCRRWSSMYVSLWFVCVCVFVCVLVWVAVTDKCSQCETLLMCKLLTPPVIQGYFAYPLPQAPHVAAVVHLLIASFESLLIEVPSAQCDSQVWVQCSASEPDVVNHDSDRGPDGHRFLHVALVDPQCPTPPRRVRLAPAKVPQTQVLAASISRSREPYRRVPSASAWLMISVHLVSALRRPDTAVLGDIHLL